MLLAQFLLTKGASKISNTNVAVVFGPINNSLPPMSCQFFQSQELIAIAMTQENHCSKQSVVQEPLRLRIPFVDVSENIEKSLRSKISFQLGLYILHNIAPETVSPPPLSCPGAGEGKGYVVSKPR